jgi:hypothetical protein
MVMCTAGAALAEQRDRAREERVDEGRRSGDDDAAAASVAQLLHDALEGADAAEDLVDVRKEVGRLGGRVQAPADALEQLELELLLGVLEHVAHGGLRDVEVAGRARDRARLHDGVEDFELTQVHGGEQCGADPWTRV